MLPTAPDEHTSAHALGNPHRGMRLRVRVVARNPLVAVPMKVRITVEFTRHERLALAYQHGQTKPADHATLAIWMESTIEATFSDVISEYDKVLAGKEMDDDE